MTDQFTPEDDARNPEWPDPIPNESTVLAAVARAQYERLPSDEQAEVDKRWAAIPEWRKQELRDEIDLDLL
jgi:hypothetical protein